MPMVTLSDAAFAELKLLAEPFVDTPESLTARIIHEEVVRRGLSSTGNGQLRSATDGVPRLNPDSHESLAFSRLLSASVDGRELTRPKWNTLMEKVHLVGLKRLGSLDALKRATRARIRQGRFEEEGFGYLPDGDFSIQGVDSNGAWDHSLRLARALAVPIRAAFEWRDRDDAARPGQAGVLEWKPNQAQ